MLCVLYDRNSLTIIIDRDQVICNIYFYYCCCLVSDSVVNSIYQNFVKNLEQSRSKFHCFIDYFFRSVKHPLVLAHFFCGTNISIWPVKNMLVQFFFLVSFLNCFLLSWHL